MKSLNLYAVGTRIKILDDVRPGGSATGRYGFYEGNFPYTVVLATHDHVFGEFLFEAYISGTLQIGPGLPAYEVFQTWEWGQPAPAAYALVLENPRLRLDDGEVIWGLQCWWTLADPGEAELHRRHTLAQAKAALDQIDDWLNSGGK